MKQTTVPELAMKILGLVFIVIGLPTIPFVLYWFILAILPGVAGHRDAVVSLATLLPSLVYVIAGLVFFFAGGAVLRKVVIADDAQISPLTVEALQSVLYSAVGLFLAMRALPQLAEFVGESVYMKHLGATSSLDAWNATRAIGAGIQCVLGFWLFLGTKGVVGFRNRTRAWGTKEPS